MNRRGWKTNERKGTLPKHEQSRHALVPECSPLRYEFVATRRRASPMIVTGFPHQVGGHIGLFTCAGHVCKPYDQRECAFYSQIGDQFTPFTAKFCGCVIVNVTEHPDRSLTLRTASPVKCHQTRRQAGDIPTFGDDGVHEAEEKAITFRVKECGKVEAKRVVNPFAVECQSKSVEKLLDKGFNRCLMLLEDIVAKYRRPCVVDLKMGTRQYGDDASPQKQKRQTEKCEASTSASLGVRMVGMQLLEDAGDCYSYINKHEGREMDSARFTAALRKFLAMADVPRCRKLLAKLERLREMLALAEGYRFFSSSILIAFDGANETDEESLQAVVPMSKKRRRSESYSSDEDTDTLEEPEVTVADISVRMIDFAHSTFSGFLEDQERHKGPDEGYLLGIDTLLRITKAFIEDAEGEDEDGAA
uniref:Kinase n=1 Tax=Steinernema glaseri TaxID=37863 RepID=A0A1I7Z5E2_9BILA